MVVLAEEVLESFFESDLSESFKLQPLPDAEISPANSGLLGDIWSSIASDNNKKMFHLFSDEIGKTIGKHQVTSLPEKLLLGTNKVKKTGTSQAFDWKIHQIGRTKSSRIVADSNTTTNHVESKSC